MELILKYQIYYVSIVNTSWYDFRKIYVTYKHKIKKSVSNRKSFTCMGWEGKWYWMFLFTTSLKSFICSIHGDLCSEGQVFSSFHRENSSASLQRNWIRNSFLPVLSDCLTRSLQFLYCYSINVIPVQDIQLQRVLIINRVYRYKTKESLFFVCVHFLFISKESWVDHLGLSCLPPRTFTADIYANTFFFFFSFTKNEKGTRCQQLWSLLWHW